MKISNLGILALIALTQSQAAYAGFFGTFCDPDCATPLPEPGTIGLFAIGAAGIAVARYIGGRRK